MKINTLILLLMSIPLCLYATEKIEKKSGKGSLYPVALRCEYLINPLGLDVSNPRLSWRSEAVDQTKRGCKQTAFQILVASRKELLIPGKADIWDSGAVRSEESVNIVYEGKKLLSGQECFWKIRVADENKKWSSWSEPSYWTMGLFPEDWKATWIGAVPIINKDISSDSISQRSADPWFRKTFSLKETPEKAVIYVASVGYHELYINGERIGENVLMPSVTDHKKRARYVTYNITNQLKEGENVIAIWLGTSWSVFPAYRTDDKPAAPIVLAQADITFSEKESLQITTDETWKSFPSPNTLLGYWDAHHFAGEEYDGFMEIEGWNGVGFDDSFWNGVAVFHPDLVVSADKTEPNRLMKEITPVAIEEIEPGLFQVDMGINYAGWFEIELEGTPGDRIGLQFSERKNEASSYGLHSVYKIGHQGKGVFRNRFNYMSGRWVRITGLAEKPSLEQIKGWMIRPNYERVGAFHCDQPLLNDIYNTTLWTFENLTLGNYVVDCPHRERRGYGGDALATTRPGLGNYQLGAFYTKWMEDWKDVQQPDGNVPYTAPTYVGGGGPSWSGYCITLPYEMYRQYGDKRILEENFPVMEKWLAFLETKAVDNMLVRWGGKWSFLGDWFWPQAWNERSRMEKEGKGLGDTVETLFFNNCHWVYSLELTSEIAAVLGETTKSLQYKKRADEVRKAVHATFFNPEDNSYVNGYPSYLAIALYTHITPIEIRDKVWKRLEHEIRVNNKGHFWGGITAGSFLFHTLLDNNCNELLYTMITKEDFPSWGNMLKHNLGTFFEDWECRGSALHSSYLYVGSWFIEALGGIRQPYAGFKEFTIEPCITLREGPKKVTSSHQSLYGRIVSDWEKQDNKIELNISIPPNTSAVLRLNGVIPNTIKENGVIVSKVKDIKSEIQNDSVTCLNLISGNYKITATIISSF